MSAATTCAKRAIVGNDQDLGAEASTRYGVPGIRSGKPRQEPGTVSPELGMVSPEPNVRQNPVAAPPARARGQHSRLSLWNANHRINRVRSRHRFRPSSEPAGAGGGSLALGASGLVASAGRSRWLICPSKSTCASDALSARRARRPNQDSHFSGRGMPTQTGGG